MLDYICYLILATIIYFATKIIKNNPSSIHLTCPLIRKIWLLTIKTNNRLIRKEKFNTLLFSELEACKELVCAMSKVQKDSHGQEIAQELLLQKLENTKDLFMAYHNNQSPENTFLTIKLFSKLKTHLNNKDFGQGKQQLCIITLNQLENRIIHNSGEGA